MNPANDWLETRLSNFPKARVTVFGDFCLDAYWLIDSGDGERSVETGKVVRRVRQQRYSLGGAGNIVANLSALGVGRIHAVGLVGQDLFGREILGLLGRTPHVDLTRILGCQDDWQTLVYSKPCIGLEEQERIDFGGFNRLAAATADALSASLESAVADSDVVILNQQVPSGASTPEMIERINAIVARHGSVPFIVDSRHQSGLFRGCILKLNAGEAQRMLGDPADEVVPSDKARNLACRLRERTARPVFLTRGENGIVVADASGVEEIAGIHIAGQVDPVGAGDTALAAIAAVLAGEGDAATAGRLANMASSITVRKLQTTGTASPEELRAIGPHPDYVYLPELADDIRLARHVEGTEIEIVRPLPKNLRIQHVLFDHDGTLSTLRQGWEDVMEPMMVRAILGRLYEQAEPALYQKVCRAVGEFIEKTTGVQTLSQMQGLADLVRQFQCVPAEEVLDMHGYKRLYDAELMTHVRQRMVKLRAGELSAADFEIKNARRLLEALHSRGVRLYLASGTDQEHVRAEAQAMGYAPLFEGRVFGAVGDVTVEAKAAVLGRIFDEFHLQGPEVLAFGDGPVEIRLAHKRGGLTVGVASDELRRFGLNAAKRRRLIRAGADLVVADYSQLSQLLAVLGIF